MFVDPNLSSQTMNDSPLREIYVSTDIETDGPLAGKHSMLSIGSAAYLADKELLGTFSANLETLPASAPDPKTAAWWATQPDNRAQRARSDDFRRSDRQPRLARRMRHAHGAGAGSL